MESHFRVRTIEHSTGEKSPMLFSRSDGLPDSLANDWKIERRSVTHSHQSLRQELFAVAFFYDVARSRNWNLSELFDSGNGLTWEMLATLREDCGRWHTDVMCRQESMRLMSSGIQKFRLDVIRKFCVWRLETVRQRIFGSGRLAESVNVIHNIDRHKNALKTSQVESRRRLGLTPSGINALQNLVDPTSPSNPFQSRFRLRNFLMVQLLLEYGLRRGELLGLRTSDVDYRAKRPKICVYRRPDEKIEKRISV